MPVRVTDEGRRGEGDNNRKGQNRIDVPTPAMATTRSRAHLFSPPVPSTPSRITPAAGMLGAPRAYRPYEEAPSGDGVTRWIKEQSLVGELIASPSSGLFYALVTTIASNVAGRIDVALLQPLTDQLMLLLLLTASVAVLLRGVTELLSAWLRPVEGAGGHGAGRFLAVLFFFLNFSFLVCFLLALTQALTMMQTLFGVSPAHAWAGLFSGGFVVAVALLVLTLPVIGVLTHESELMAHGRPPASAVSPPAPSRA